MVSTRIFEAENTDSLRSLAQKGVRLQGRWLAKIHSLPVPALTPDTKTISRLVGQRTAYLDCGRRDLESTLPFVPTEQYDQDLCERLSTDQSFFAYYCEHLRPEFFLEARKLGILNKLNPKERGIWMSLALARSTKNRSELASFSFLSTVYRQDGVPESWPLNVRNFPYN